MILETLPSVQKLSAREKWILANEIWADLENDPEAMPVSDEVLDELDRRFARFDEKGDAETTDWQSAKQRIVSSREN